MKAIVQTGYGLPDVVLGLRDIQTPRIDDGELLVEVHAASVIGSRTGKVEESVDLCPIENTAESSLGKNAQSTTWELTR